MSVLHNFYKSSKRGQSTPSVLFDIGQFILLLLFLGWLSSKSIENMGYYWQWHQIPGFIATLVNGHFKAGPLLEGVIVTLQISGWSLIFAFLIGLVTALLRLSNSVVGRYISIFYLEISRNIPLLIQIFFIYFVLGPILGTDRFTSAVIALSFFEGAFASEIFRSGILSVGRGQHEASASLGLSTVDTYRFVILPQAIRNVLPPLVSQGISLVKDSALVSTIAIYDLTMHAQALVAETYLTFEIWFTVALLYLIINIFLSVVVSLLEGRLQRH